MELVRRPSSGIRTKYTKKGVGVRPPPFYVKVEEYKI
jgi:hypothetical protein